MRISTFCFSPADRLRTRARRIDAEGHRLHEVFELFRLGLPVDDGRHVLAGHDQVFDHGHVLDQREVLVDHADAERMGLPGILQFDVVRRRRGPSRCRPGRFP